MNNKIRILTAVPYSGLEILCHLSNGQTRRFLLSEYIKDHNEFKEAENVDVFYYVQVNKYGSKIEFKDDLFISLEDIIKYSHKYDVKKENKKQMKKIYEYCKDVRKKDKITQKQIAYITNIPQSGIARIESGKSDVQLSTLLSYLIPLGLTLTITENEGSLSYQTRKAIKSANKNKGCTRYTSINELKADLDL